MKPTVIDITDREEFLRTAIDQLNKEIDAFDHFFTTPGRTTIHPAFGSMNRAERVTWHGKHFTHHFKQFGLIKSA